MFQNYQPVRNEKQEIAKAEKAVEIAVACGIDWQFAHDVLDAGEVDLNLATAGQAARAILDMAVGNSGRYGVPNWDKFNAMMKQGK